MQQLSAKISTFALVCYFIVKLAAAGKKYSARVLQCVNAKCDYTREVAACDANTARSGVISLRVFTSTVMHVGLPDFPRRNTGDFFRRSIQVQSAQCVDI